MKTERYNIHTNTRKIGMNKYKITETVKLNGRKVKEATKTITFKK